MRAQIGILRPLMGLVMGMAVVVWGGVDASAQGTQGPAKPNAGAAAKPLVDPAKGRREVVSGIKLYEKGQYSQSVSKFTGAMRVGGLSQTDMAKALYYRGLALQRQKKSAEAISDLTSALYLKDGLSESERAKATATRIEAYKAVGVSAPVLVASRAPAAVHPAAQTAAVPQNSVPTLAPKTGAKPIPATSPLAPPGGTLAVAEKKTQTAAVSNKSASWSAVTQPGGVAKPVPPPANTSSGNNVLTESVNNVGNFFSNLFTGGSSSPSSSPPPSQVSSPIATSSTTPAGQTSGWSSATTQKAPGLQAKASLPVKNKPTAPLAKAKPTQVAAAQLRTPKIRAPSGKYRVQVAAVRSEAEAQQLVVLLRQKYGTSMGPRSPKIDEAVYGNMGKFYRVHVGPYARPKDTKPFCTALSSSGYDCMIVTK